MRGHWGKLALGLWVSIYSVGCGNFPRTPFTGDPSLPTFTLKPADYCQKDANGQYSSPDNVTHGSTADYVWGQGGGCVTRPILEAWGVTHNIPLMQWDGVSSSSVRVGNPPKRTSNYYEINYVVHNTITVTWTMDWFQTVGSGDKSAPKIVWINYKRVAGTQYIPYWEGTIYFEQLENGVTAFAMSNQINAAQTDETDAGTTVSDLLTKVRTGSSVPIP